MTSSGLMKETFKWDPQFSEHSDTFGADSGDTNDSPF